MDLCRLGIRETQRLIRDGRISAVEITEAYLERISRTEGALSAWELIDADGALAEAQRLESGRDLLLARCPLFGIPVGIKDVIDVRGMPTTAGFEPRRDLVAEEDATVVNGLRGAGAIFLGKTVATQFAWADDPAATYNPWDRDVTPGGSSSGSAVAVAARQVPAALGTQTGGSLLRPAAYCGVAAMKPTMGSVSRRGVYPTSWTFDHVGLMARSVDDLELLFAPLVGTGSLGSEKVDPIDGRTARLAILTDLSEGAQPEIRDAMAKALDQLSNAGAQLTEVTLPVSLDLILAVFTIVSCSEAVALHSAEFESQGEHFRSGARANMEVGSCLPALAYVQARRVLAKVRPRIRALLDPAIDALVLPTASGPPPGRQTTGDFSLQVPWSLAGMPAINLPLVIQDQPYPVGLQLVGGCHADRELLETARWCEQALADLVVTDWPDPPPTVGPGS